MNVRNFKHIFYRENIITITKGTKIFILLYFSTRISCVSTNILIENNVSNFHLKYRHFIEFDL